MCLPCTNQIPLQKDPELTTKEAVLTLSCQMKWHSGTIYLRNTWYTRLRGMPSDDGFGRVGKGKRRPGWSGLNEEARSGSFRGLWSCLKLLDIGWRGLGLHCLSVYGPTALWVWECTVVLVMGMLSDWSTPVWLWNPPPWCLFSLARGRSRSTVTGLGFLLCCLWTNQHAQINNQSITRIDSVHWFPIGKHKVGEDGGNSQWAHRWKRIQQNKDIQVGPAWCQCG